jgi:hypothetical protein
MTVLQRTRARGPSLAAVTVREPRAEQTGSTSCLLMPLHPERALARALVQHLTGELPDVEFTLKEREGIDVLWVCGYEDGNAALIRGLRARHPGAVLLVTAKDHGTPSEEDSWATEVLGAGADHALSWPVDLARLTRVLRRRPVRQRA